jgi:hypothetical protein
MGPGPAAVFADNSLKNKGYPLLARSLLWSEWFVLMSRLT